MVRLVFRLPIPKSDERFARQYRYELPPRVSPGFTLLRHSSPSFGSQHVCSHSNLSQATDRSIVPPTREQESHLMGRNPLYFHCALGFVTQILAYMLDSLVRVSRRVEENHFVIIANPATDTSKAVFTFYTDRALLSHALGQTDLKASYSEECGFSSSFRPNVGRKD